MTPGGEGRVRPAPTLELVCDGSPVLVQAEDVVVGRIPKCTVRVVHPLVSREHCRIEMRDDGVFVVDLGSANGTWLNGVRVESRSQLRTGDRLGLGRDGAVLVVQRATVGGVDVSRRAREEDMNTMLAGDARAVGAVVAHVEVAAEALPALGAADEPPTRAIGEAARADAPKPAPPIPVVAAMQTSEIAPGAESPRTTEIAVPAAPARRGFASGFAVGFVVGLALVAAALKFTHVLDPIRPAAGETRPR
jgi:predicted component of type VI protein secretion system